MKAGGPWASALLIYGLYRRTMSRLGSKRSPSAGKVLLWLVPLMFVGPFAGSILWHALLTMPTPLAVFLGAAITHRIVRWFLRRYR